MVLFSACKENKQLSDSNTPTKNPIDLVFPQLDTENSRWFLFSSACRPFGMVNLSPDTQIDGAWGSGYRYKTDTIKGFSHIHGWQLSGLSVMPINLKEERGNEIFKDFYSPFSHENEKVSPGFHKVHLERYGIHAELTSTKRVGLHNYTFPKESRPAVLFNLNTPLGPCENRNGELNQINDHTLTGQLEMAPTHRRPKPFKLFYHISLSTKIESIQKDTITGNYVVFTDDEQKNVLMKVGLSYTSIENAKNNMIAELDHWDFNRVVEESKNEWNNMLGRIKVEGGTEKQQKRFYTDLWHALQGRRVISDVNGAYPDSTGDTFRVAQLPLDAKGMPMFNHYNSDSFWGAQWTLNTLWGLAYPDITEEFVNSLMQYYKDGGLIPRGPSGGNYTYVMTGASTTPFIVSAVQKNIVKNNLDSIYEALRKNHMPGGIMEKAGYEHNTSLGGGLGYYLEKGYVPYPIPEGKFGGHQDGASLTLEYAYQDWTLAQFAKKLQREEDYKIFMNRSQNYKNVFDAESSWMRPKNVDGQWKSDFDPYLYENGFNESNGSQATWFVPHDILGLAQLMGGKEKAVEKLNGQFKASEKQGFTSGTSHEVEMHPEYSRIPINYGNQPSINTAFVFNHLGRPDLTQYWSREIIDKVFSGLDPSTGYNGDEDQGLMGALSVLLKMGLFQMNGGTDSDPVYDLGSPLFDKISITLHPDYFPGDKFVIETINNGIDHKQLEQVAFNGKILDTMAIEHSSIVKGGRLTFKFK
ncbi:glycoside hydrolase family 92 protein [Maribacter algicola]|uniref:Glycoside hydrolase family 92 protein n=2 Tax=Maribacter algicola TaxID=2498892 RepID=A0A426RJJ1_9FLAO|nr:glycoside hydrolase family 92 protein [Maribacter algicola]